MFFFFFLVELGKLVLPYKLNQITYYMYFHIMHSHIAPSLFTCFVVVRMQWWMTKTLLSIHRMVSLTYLRFFLSENGAHYLRQPRFNKSFCLLLYKKKLVGACFLVPSSQNIFFWGQKVQKVDVFIWSIGSMHKEILVRI